VIFPVGEGDLAIELSARVSVDPLVLSELLGDLGAGVLATAARSRSLTGKYEQLSGRKRSGSA
jgi:hypothetical protein